MYSFLIVSVLVITFTSVCRSGIHTRYHADSGIPSETSCNHLSSPASSRDIASACLEPGRDGEVVELAPLCELALVCSKVSPYSAVLGNTHCVCEKCEIFVIVLVQDRLHRLNSTFYLAVRLWKSWRYGHVLKPATLANRIVTRYLIIVCPVCHSDCILSSV